MTEEEFEGIKNSLDFMSGESTTISEQQKLIMDLMEKIKELKRQHAEKVKRIAFFECHVADLEQYFRINNVIISTLETKPWLFAWAVTPADVAEHIEPVSTMSPTRS